MYHEEIYLFNDFDGCIGSHIEDACVYSTRRK